MKKLLVLLMVLGMASFANAAIVISVNGDTNVEEITINASDTITVDVYNLGSGSDPIDFLAYLDFYYTSEGSYALSNARLGPAAGDFPASFIGPYDNGYDGEEYEIDQAWAVGSSEVTGAIFLVDMHCELAGTDVIVELWDARVGFDAPVDLLTIHQVVPEPITIGLLGLGGLFLRRRK